MAFTSLIAPVIFFAIVMILFGDFIIQILQLIPELLQMVALIFDPEKFIKELTFGIFTGIMMLFSHIFDYMDGIFRAVVDKTGVSDNIFGMNANSGNVTKIYGRLCKNVYTRRGLQCKGVREKFNHKEEGYIKGLFLATINNYIANIKNGKKTDYYQNRSDTWWKLNLNINDKNEQDISELYKKVFKSGVYINQFNIENSSINISVRNNNPAEDDDTKLVLQKAGLIYTQMFNDIKNLKIKFNGQEYGIKSYDTSNDVVCAKTTFFRYVVLVLCPPLYVAMFKGFKGWHYVVIDIILTLLFYFPGLFYAYIVCVTCGFD